MKTTTGKSLRKKHDYQFGEQSDVGWQRKADHRRNEQEQAYHNQAHKEMVRRVIAKVSAL